MKVEGCIKIEENRLQVFARSCNAWRNSLRFNLWKTCFSMWNAFGSTADVAKNQIFKGIWYKLMKCMIKKLIKVVGLIKCVLKINCRLWIKFFINFLSYLFFPKFPGEDHGVYTYNWCCTTYFTCFKLYFQGDF